MTSPRVPIVGRCPVDCAVGETSAVFERDRGPGATDRRVAASRLYAAAVR